MKKIKNLILPFLVISLFFACDSDDEVADTRPPSVDFNLTPSRPSAEEEILFYADPEEDSGEIATWSWSFGDSENSTSNKRNPYFTYDSAGTYEVVLTATNHAGDAVDVTKSVTVLPAPSNDFPASIAWEFSTNTTVRSINDGSSSPVIGDDGTIYYVESRATSESSVVAVTDGGETANLKWASNEVGGELPNAPSIGPDGNIFINSWVGSKAISKLSSEDGSIIWSGDIGTGVSNNTAAVDSQGNSYHGSRSQGANGGVFSWDADGEKRWEITDVGAFYAAPAISADEQTVYFLNTSSGKIWAVNADDGTEKWDSPVGLESGIHGTSLSIDADGTIYFTTNTHVVAVTDDGQTGSVKWQTEVNDASNSGVVIGPGGELFTGSKGGLLSLDPSNGDIIWSFEREIVESVPAVDENGNIYVGASNGFFYIVNSDGVQVKEMELGDNLVNSPTIADDGTVYVEAFDNSVIKLYKIAVENSGPADSAWPMKGQNVKNTGKAE